MSIFKSVFVLFLFVFSTFSYSYTCKQISDAYHVDYVDLPDVFYFISDSEWDGANLNNSCGFSQFNMNDSTAYNDKFILAFIFDSSIGVNNSATIFSFDSPSYGSLQSAKDAIDSAVVDCSTVIPQTQQISFNNVLVTDANALISSSSTYCYYAASDNKYCLSTIVPSASFNIASFSNEVYSDIIYTYELTGQLCETPPDPPTPNLTPISMVDIDGDGIPDQYDGCPDDITNICNDVVDTDGDGIPDADDSCPTDSTNTCNDSGDTGLDSSALVDAVNELGLSNTTGFNSVVSSLNTLNSSIIDLSNVVIDGNQAIINTIDGNFENQTSLVTAKIDELITAVGSSGGSGGSGGSGDVNVTVTGLDELNMTIDELNTSVENNSGFLETMIDFFTQDSSIDYGIEGRSVAEQEGAIKVSFANRILTDVPLFASISNISLNTSNSCEPYNFTNPMNDELVVLDAHCSILSNVASVMSVVMILVWSIVALRILID